MRGLVIFNTALLDSAKGALVLVWIVSTLMSGLIAYVGFRGPVR